MDRPPVFSLEVLTDHALLNDILKGFSYFSGLDFYLVLPAKAT
jgi:hypothetical protein